MTQPNDPHGSANAPLVFNDDDRQLIETTVAGMRRTNMDLTANFGFTDEGDEWVVIEVPQVRSFHICRNATSYVIIGYPQEWEGPSLLDVIRSSPLHFILGGAYGALPTTKQPVLVDGCVCRRQTPRSEVDQASALNGSSTLQGPEASEQGAAGGQGVSPVG